MPLDSTSPQIEKPRRQEEVAGFQVGVKGVEEPGKSAMSDLLKNGGLDEVFKIGHRPPFYAKIGPLFKGAK